MRVCIAQMGLILDDIQAHIRKIKNIILDYRSADLIVFPELILHGHPSFHKPEGLLHRRTKAFYSHASKDLDLYTFVRDVGARVIIGDLKRRGDKYYNLATYIDGNCIDAYVKTHVHWSENFVPGRELKVFEAPAGKIGITICFDAAFPEVMRVLALKGAEVIVNLAAVPASFPVKYMWRRLEAAALNNQVFVIYCNRPGEVFSGHSAVFDPRGEVVAHAGAEEEILQAEIDLGEVAKWRAEEEIYSHMRPVLYRQIARMAKRRPERKYAEAVEALRRMETKVGGPLPPGEEPEQLTPSAPAAEDG